MAYEWVQQLGGYWVGQPQNEWAHTVEQFHRGWDQSQRDHYE